MENLMEMKEILEKVQKIVEIDSSKRHVILVLAGSLSMATLQELQSSWDREFGARPLFIVHGGDQDSVRILEIDSKSNPKRLPVDEKEREGSCGV